MPRQLKNLRIDEVSSVDRGAGRGVRVLLTKRDPALLEAIEKGDQSKVDLCLKALDASIASIIADAAVTDKPAEIAKSIAQFKATLSGQQENDMPPEQIQKMIDDAVTKANEPKDALIKTLQNEVVLLKMSDKHKAHMDSLSGDAKDKFAAMAPADREDCMNKALEVAKGDPMVKALAGENETLRKSNEDLAKRLTAIEDERQLDICKREADEMGWKDADAGATLQKARKGDLESIKKLEAFTATVIKQRDEAARTGGIFKEMGHGGGGKAGGDAVSELNAKAAELRKAKPELTQEQAFDKVYTDPANAELAKRERDERMAKIHRAA